MLLDGIGKGQLEEASAKILPTPTTIATTICISWRFSLVLDLLSAQVAPTFQIVPEGSRHDLTRWRAATNREGAPDEALG